MEDPKNWDKKARKAECWNCDAVVKTDYYGNYECDICDVIWEVAYKSSSRMTYKFTRPHPDYVDHATVYMPSPA